MPRQVGARGLGGVPQIPLSPPLPPQAGEGDQESVLSLPKEGEGFWDSLYNLMQNREMT